MVERSEDTFQFFRQLEGFNLGGIGEAVHHVGKSSKLHCFGYGFPAELDQFGGIARINPFFYHLVETEKRTCLEHSAEDGLLPHKIRFYFGNERRGQDAGPVSPGTGGVGFRHFHTDSLRIVFRMNGDKGGNTESPFVLLPHLASR